MMLHRTMTEQQPMMHVRTAIAQAAQQQTKHKTMHTFGDYHYVPARVQADSYPLPVAKQREYDRVITAAPPQQAAEQAAQAHRSPAGQVAEQVVAYARPIESMPKEFPVDQKQFTSQPPVDSHIAYGSLPYHQMDLESLHMRAIQMQTWKQYVAQTRTSPQVHAFITCVDALFAEFNHQCEHAQHMSDYQAAYTTLLKIEMVIGEIEKIKPLSYVLSYDIYHAVKHMQSPLLDLFLGEKRALTSTDTSQIAWALHDYYKKMAQIFDKKLAAFPQGKLKQAIDTYKRSSFLSKAWQSVSHYAVKGSRDLTVARKQQQYHQLFEQQHQFLKHACGMRVDGLSKPWQDRYVTRQRSAHQALAEKSFYTRTYMLQESTQAQLKALGLNPKALMQLQGNALQHRLQAELVKLANIVAGDKHAFAESALHFAHTGALCNQAGRIQEAWTVADIGWAIVDHIKAVGEGAWEGAAGAWNVVRHPITFTQNLTTNIGTACYELLCYRWHCLGVEARLINGDEQAIMEAALLDLHSDRIKQSITNALAECSTRDLLKQGTKAFVDYKITSKMLHSFSKLLTSIKPHVVKPLLPATHPIKAQLPRTVYEAAFDPATKAYVVESMNKVCKSAQEFKRIAPAEFAQNIDQVSKGSKGAVLVPKDAVIKATLDTNRLAAFKTGIQEAARATKIIEVCKPTISNFPKKNAYYKDDLLAELSKFQGERFNVGQHTFLLDKGNLKHILTRHHPAFWDGSIKDKQTFIPKGFTAEDIISVIKKVLNQNRDIVLQRGNNAKYQIRGNIDGIEYVVGLKKGGSIRQFYIPIKE